MRTGILDTQASIQMSFQRWLQLVTTDVDHLRCNTKKSNVACEDRGVTPKPPTDILSGQKTFPFNPKQHLCIYLPPVKSRPHQKCKNDRATRAP